MELCYAWTAFGECELGLMKVTEHNIQDTDLNLDDINLLIRLVKEDSKNYEGDRVKLLYCGVLIGKLICLRNDIIK